jgi:hypothetical protein
MTTVHEHVDVETEVARAARLLLDLDRYADRVRTDDPTTARVVALDHRLDALRHLLARLVDAPG